MWFEGKCTLRPMILLQMGILIRSFSESQEMSEEIETEMRYRYLITGYFLS